MTIRNKIKIDFYLEDGCEQEKGEVNVEQQPLNFSIYDPLFYELIDDAVSSWLEGNKIVKATNRLTSF